MSDAAGRSVPRATPRPQTSRETPRAPNCESDAATLERFPKQNRAQAPPGVSVTEEERLALGKARNREHARNTRARKKEAIECLKREVGDAAARRADDARVAARREAVVDRVFAKRGEGVVDANEWSKFLEDDFELWQPVSECAARRPRDVAGDRRVVARGPEGMAFDVAALTTLLRAVGRSGALSRRVAAPPAIECASLRAAVEPGAAGDADAAFDAHRARHVADVIFGHWGARTTDARAHGARHEVEMRGLFCATFPPGARRRRRRRRLAATPRPRRGYFSVVVRGDAAAATFPGDSRRRRGRGVALSPATRGDAAAATWIYRGAESRPRRGSSAEATRGRDLEHQRR